MLLNYYKLIFLINLFLRQTFQKNCCLVNVNCRPDKKINCSKLKENKKEESIENINNTIQKIKCCNCCKLIKNPPPLILAPYEYINPNMNRTDKNIETHPLYIPSLKNSLDKDLIVETKVVNPKLFLEKFNEKMEDEIVMKDSFSETKISKINKNSLKVETTLDSEKVFDFYNTKHNLKKNSVLQIEKIID